MNRYVFPLMVVLSVFLSSEVSGSPQVKPKADADAPNKLDAVLGVRTAPGALVMNVHPGSPADQVGLDVCDLIAGFNGQGIQGYGDPAAFLGAMREAAMLAGAELEVWKSADSGQSYQQKRFRLRIPSQSGAKIGASVTFQALVLEVLKDGPAEVAGVQSGEFIDQVNGQPVSEMQSILDLDQQISALAQQYGEVLLTLSRWKPVRGSADWKTSHTTREVLVRLSDRKN